MTFAFCLLTFDCPHWPYSYGDSAGFTPDFPFNPECSGTKFAANVGSFGDAQQINIWGN